MKKLVLVLLSLIVAISFAQEKTGEYIGSDKCKMCHKKEDSGEQYKIWSEGAHVKSFETLKGEKALQIAKKMGLATTPDKAPECLSCHVTGWGSASGYQLEVDPLDKKAVKINADLERVGCESCHGAGSLYKSKKTMLGLRSGEFKGADYGLNSITEKTCTTCHNPDSPTYVKFIYEDRIKEISHPVPAPAPAK